QVREQEPNHGGVRDRFRAHLTGEVKVVALRQLAGGGPPAISVNAIAREWGLSGPALYRYFESRDALVTELVRDAYGDFSVALHAAVEEAPAARRPAALARA